MLAPQVANRMVDDIEQCAAAQRHRDGKVLIRARELRDSERADRVLAQRHVVVEDRIDLAAMQCIDRVGHRFDVADRCGGEPAADLGPRQRVGDHRDPAAPLLRVRGEFERTRVQEREGRAIVRLGRPRSCVIVSWAIEQSTRPPSLIVACAMRVA